MKGKVYLVVSLFLLVFFYVHFLEADDTVKILILDNPNTPLPSGNIEDLGNVKGEIFFNRESYTGFFEVQRDEKGLYVINNLPLEKYVEGVVASETGKDWELEALKAQAVISRTYAVFHKNLNIKKDFHLTSSVLHQVYRDDNMNPLINRAVEETRGEILTYENNPIKAFYHSTCVGKTELPEEVWGESYPYLQSVDCNGKGSPYDNWQRRFTFEEIEKATGISKIKDIIIASYTSTGRVRVLKVISHADETSTSSTEIKATELRKLLGYRELPSTHFSIRMDKGEVVFQGKGWGHGVGLSQWGALEMARQGKDYREILAHYYPGTRIERR